MNKPTSVLISGASIAGPVLGYWLTKYGFDVTIVERAPAPRTGGYAVDFRGPVMDILKKMGILEDIKKHQTDMGAVSFVTEENKRIADMPSFFLSGEVEILRGDLVEILYNLTKDKVRYILGDSIAQLQDTGSEVRVQFEHAKPQTYDLVIGADGIHSHVRQLIFGDEAQFVKHLGYYVSIFTLPNYLNLDHTGRYYATPGKLSAVYSAKNNTEAKASFYFTSPPLTYGRHDINEQKELVHQVFANEKWEVPKLLAAMKPADDFYFDAVAQVHMDMWHKGRVGLVGDAAYCASPLAGQGTPMAFVGAYILAGELKAADGDYEQAFTRYQEAMKEYVKQSQGSVDQAAMFFIPKSKFMIRMRNFNFRIMPYLPWKGLIEKASVGPANSVNLKDY
jgi:2-polyprenyl-6-methoxyphenol hydroxylase-like FAD-dependent oxidoreductase